MRMMTCMALLGVLWAGATMAAEVTPQQYATGSSWEAALSDMPEIEMMGASALTSWGGNIYVLQGNTLRKLSLDLQPIASVQLTGTPLVLASMDEARALSSCGMNLPDPSGRMSAQMTGPATTGSQFNQFGATTQNYWQTTGCPPIPASYGQAVEQAVSQDMMQGLHQAHTVCSLGQANLAADQNGVYLLRGGWLTVFDHNLRELRSQQVMPTIASAADCMICRNAMASGVLMDQVRFRGMQEGLCPGPGAYGGTVYMGDTMRERMSARIPASTGQLGTYPGEIPASLGTAVPVAPGTGAAPGSFDTTMPATGTRYGPSSAGSVQQWQAMQQATTASGEAFGPAMGATTPGTATRAGTATYAPQTWAAPGAPGTTPGTVSSPTTVTAPAGVQAYQGAPGTTPGTTGAARGGTASVPAQITAPQTWQQPITVSPMPSQTWQQPAGIQQPMSWQQPAGQVYQQPSGQFYQQPARQVWQQPSDIMIEAGMQQTRPGQYDWMYELPGITGGNVVPLATRNLTSNGSVLFGATGTQAGPQFLHLNVLQPSGIAMPGATVTAYLYNRGDVNRGRQLNLIRRAPGEYMIRFDPQMSGDTLAVRVMRPGMTDEVVYFSLAGSEMAPY